MVLVRVRGGDVACRGLSFGGLGGWRRPREAHRRQQSRWSWRPELFARRSVRSDPPVIVRNRPIGLGPTPCVVSRYRSTTSVKSSALSASRTRSRRMSCSVISPADRAAHLRSRRTISSTAVSTASNGNVRSVARRSGPAGTSGSNVATGTPRCSTVRYPSALTVIAAGICANALMDVRSVSSATAEMCGGSGGVAGCGGVGPSSAAGLWSPRSTA